MKAGDFIGPAQAMAAQFNRDSEYDRLRTQLAAAQERVRVLREALTDIEREAQKIIPGNMGNVIDDTIKPRVQAYLRQWIISCAKQALAATADNAQGEADKGKGEV